MRDIEQKCVQRTSPSQSNLRLISPLPRCSTASRLIYDARVRQERMRLTAALQIPCRWPGQHQGTQQLRSCVIRRRSTSHIIILKNCRSTHDWSVFHPILLQRRLTRILISCWSQQSRRRDFKMPIISAICFPLYPYFWWHAWGGRNQVRCLIGNGSGEFTFSCPFFFCGLVGNSGVTLTDL
jgi:hypothetical protein